MRMTQDDYEQRAARVADGSADDDDRRLVAHYEREGYTAGEGVAMQIAATGTAEVIPGPKKRVSRGRGNGDRGQTR